MEGVSRAITRGGEPGAMLGVVVGGRNTQRSPWPRLGSSGASLLNKHVPKGGGLEIARHNQFFLQPSNP